jgi:hypothetical protein
MIDPHGIHYPGTPEYDNATRLWNGAVTSHRTLLTAGTQT